MRGMERTLVARVADFVAAMNDVAQKAGTANSDVERNIASFKEMSAKTLDDLSQLAGQFDVHAHSLADAVALIDGSNRQTQGALTERGAALEQLMAALDSKAADLEERLTRFAAVLDQSFEGAGERARGIARLTAESATSGAEAIRENFEAIRSGTEEERTRLSEAMHSIYEQASEESHTMLSQAAQRFAEVLDELKQMSADMRRELETTRAELRKGILELPQETADTASHMRRVIVDQIEALAELNRIVARHNRELDVVEPGALRMEPLEVTSRRGGVREEPVRSNGNPRGEPARARSDITGMVPPAMPPRRAEAPALSPPQADAAAELWDRYKRGEHNVFTRKLYTMQGQKAFEEIRKRYRGDGEFKRAVDRYVGEFERLLEEVSREDRGQTLARTYLTSETGKVYTMLAHAAGRFD